MRLDTKNIFDQKIPNTLVASKVPIQTPHLKLEEDLGLLVLLTGSSSNGQDLIIAAARRRFSGNPLFDFPIRISTRSSEHDTEQIGVARSIFHSIEVHNGFAVSWKHENILHGLTLGSLMSLEEGRIVVVAVCAEAIPQFRDIWPKIEIIEMSSDLDGARPKSRVWRSSCYRSSQSPSISHSSNIAQAVRNFLILLDELKKQHKAS